MDITIIVNDADAQRRIAALSLEDLGQAIAIAVAADGVKPRAQYYPPQKRGKQPFKTAKQRRFFFAALRDGRIVVPYSRTYRLYSDWRVQAVPPFNAVVTNTTPYANRVVGLQSEQSQYHQGWWIGVERIAEEVEANNAAEIGQKAATLAILRTGLAP